MIDDQLQLMDSIHEHAMTSYGRFTQTNDIIDLEQAISLYREELSLRISEDFARVVCLDKLAKTLNNRFELNHDLASLDEALTYRRELLHLSSLGHCRRAAALSKLA